MNVTFGPDATKVEAPQPQQTQAVAPVASPGVPTAPGLDGDKLPDFRDIILPRVNLAQNIGQLKDLFEPGTLVFGQQVELFCPPDVDVATGNVRRAATPPATVIVLGFFPTRFVEKVPGGGRGAIVGTEEAVRLAGGTLDYKEFKLKEASGMKRFEYMVTAMVLVERPTTAKDDDTVFIFPAGGKKYAIGLWSMKGTAYTSAAKFIFTQRSLGGLRGGYWTMALSVTSRLEQNRNNPQQSYWVPVCAIKEKISPELTTLALQIRAGNITPPPIAPEQAGAE